MSQTKIEMPIGPEAKEAGRVFDEELTKFLATYGIQKRTTGHFLKVAEKLVQIAINQAVNREGFKALEEISREAQEEVRGAE